MGTILRPYKGYIGQIDVDIDSGILHGRVIGLKDVISFSGITVAKVNESFHEAIDEYLAFCEKVGNKPEKSFSGRIAYRTKPQTHQKISVAAQLVGKSVNTWMDEVLGSAADKTIAEATEENVEVYEFKNNDSQQTLHAKT